MVGVALMLEVIVWTLQIAHGLEVKHCWICTRVSMTRRAAYIFGGSLQAFGGAYLLAWTWCFMKPSHLHELWQYSSSDLLQLQHTAISLNAIVGGFSDILTGKGCHKEMGWQMGWTLSMVCCGLVFLVHPQMDLAASTKHTLLGSSLIFGAIFMLAERYHQREMQGEGRFSELPSWYIVWSGGAFVFAAAVLAFYQEPHREQHQGHFPRCHPGWPITKAALIFGVCFGTALCVRTCMWCCEDHSEREYGRLPEEACMENGSLHDSTSDKARHSVSVLLDGMS